MGRDLEQADAEREAEDRAGQRGDDLCHDQPGPDLLRGSAQRERHCQGDQRDRDGGQHLLRSGDLRAD
jgi:hypothetical protein